MSDPVIEARELRFSYRPGEEVLKGLSFSIREGEMVALTGPSGSGKSTLFYLLGCLIERFDGEVLVHGKSTRSLNDFEKSLLRNQTIGFVFQQFYLLPRSTVRENILLPARYPYEGATVTAADLTRVELIAKNLGIDHLLDRKPQELSGGQQQRVAIARALFRNPSVILADEPTGNLDSASSAEVMDTLRSLHREGRTVVIITHSPEIAAQCTRVLRIRDGRLESDESLGQDSRPSHKIENLRSDLGSEGPGASFGFVSLVKSFPSAWLNIRRSKAKSLLTMLGVSLGVAAVLSTMSLGAFAKQKILEGYEALGINTLQFWGYGNWRQRSSFAPAVFRYFSWQNDVLPLMRIFPDIEAISPIFSWGRPTISFGGVSLSEKTGALGVNETYLAIRGQEISEGRALSTYDMESSSPLCVVGAEIRAQLFPSMSAIGKSISVGQEGGSSMPCRIIGVLAPQTSSQEYFQPDFQVLLPHTYFVKSGISPWDRELHEFLLKIRPGVDASEVGEKIEGYFLSRYGSTGSFNASNDAKLIAQMKLFLNVFSSLLTAVALIALLVGGVGINNMMLVNLSERLKELGLRKALGATSRHLRMLVLSESLLLCLSAGVAGLFVGFFAYQGLVLAATKLIPKLEFAWIFEPWAFVISFAAILTTGIASGIVPAMRAEKLDVMEALRQDA